MFAYPTLRGYFAFFLLLGSAFVAGCSTHPIPQDVVGLSVYDIANKIRCEAREVLIREIDAEPNRKKNIADFQIADALLTEQIKTEQTRFELIGAQIALDRDSLTAAERLNSAEIDEQLAQLTEWLRADPNVKRNGLAKAKSAFEVLKKQIIERDNINKKILKFNVKARTHESNRLVGLQRLAVLQSAHETRFADPMKFLGNTLAYALRFEIDEINDLRLNSADYTRALALGTISLGLSAGAKKQRKGKREVRVAATFRELLALEKQCGLGNYLVDDGGLHTLKYPIRGRIGLHEVIVQYLTIADGKFKLSETASSGKTYISTVTFTTTIDGSVKPSAAITRSFGDKFSISGTLMGQRQDVHEATIVIVPLKPKEPDPIVNVRIVNSEELVKD